MVEGQCVATGETPVAVQSVASCRKLSQRLIAKVEPGSTFATAIVRRVRQTSYFYDSLLRFPGNRREFRSRKWRRKLRMVTCPSEPFPFHFVFGHCAFPSADTLQWILRTFPARHSLPLRRTILVRSSMTTRRSTCLHRHQTPRP